MIAKKSMYLYLVVGCFFVSRCSQNQSEAFSKDCTNVKDFGAVGDGITDDTAALQKAVAASTHICFPPGVYSIDGIALRPNTTLEGSTDVTLKHRSGKTPVIALASHTRVTGFSVQGTNETSAAEPVDCMFASRVEDLRIENMVLAHCNRGLELEDLSQYVVANSRIANAKQQCVNLVKANQGRVSNNVVDACAHGIQWWGGDGAVSEAIGISDISITGNLVSAVDGGGIWGSLGERITITGNTVQHCGDVGIDPEASRNVTINGNAVSDAKNGGIALFYGSQHVNISGNAITQSQPDASGVQIYGSRVAKDIQVIGYTIHTATSYGVYATVDALQDAMFANNTIRVDSGVQGMRFLRANRISVLGNQIFVKASTGISLEGTKDSLLADNWIETSQDTSSYKDDAGGIFNYWSTDDKGVYPAKGNVISGNVIKGFVSSVKDTCWGGDLQTGIWIVDNRLSTIFRWQGAGWNGKVEGNVDIADPTRAINSMEYIK